MKKLSFLLFIVIVLTTVSYVKSKVISKNKMLDIPVITTDKVPTRFCAGEYFEVSFQASGTFTVGNIFTAQISDKFGGWTSPVDIGNLNSEIPGIIAARIPKTTAEGFGYRVRVISSEPGVIGSDNGDNITIYPVANTNIIGDTIVCNNVV